MQDSPVRPNILYLTHGVFDKGGISRYGRYQITALRDKFGAESVHVLSLKGRQIGDFEQLFDVSWCGSVPLTTVSRGHFVAVAIRYAIEKRPAFVLTGHVNFGPLGLFLARMVRARLVQNVYGRELWFGLSYARRQALRKADLIISDCHNSADYIIDSKYANKRPTVIWDCVDLERYTPGTPSSMALMRYGLDLSTRFRILFLGRLNHDTRYKGAERLLHLATHLPQDNFDIIIAGNGNDLDHLRTVAKELGIQSRTIFTGSIDECHLPDVYRSADAFYLASEVGFGKGEGIPLTPLEAMACGVPVIVGNQDGSREIIEDRGGVCCDPHDLTQQADYLIRLQQDQHYHKRERQAARSRAEAAFGYPAFAKKSVKALGCLLNDKRR